jgi:hypothetical protein
MAQAKNPLDEIVDFAADQMMAEVKGVPEDSPPFASRKLTQAEQLQRYMEMRDDPAVWLRLLDERGLRATVEYATKMEHQMKTRSDAETEPP